MRQPSAGDLARHAIPQATLERLAQRASFPGNPTKGAPITITKRDFLDLARVRWSVRGFDARELAKTFDLPANLRPVALMPMGYPAEKAKPSNWHWRRKSAEELCRFV